MSKRNFMTTIRSAFIATITALVLTSGAALAQSSGEESEESGGAAQASGEAVGGVISEVPGVIGNFFSGIGEGAGVHGIFDWAAFLIGISFLISVVRGVRRGRIVGPAIRGFIGVALMGWAVS